MKPALKLNAIEQEHLQELYDAAGVSRDELPYTEEYTKLVQDFQDRTFKNADAEQVFSALLKYTRSSTNTAKDVGEAVIDAEQLKTLKAILKRHVKGKIVPHSSEFEAAHKEFLKTSGKELSPRDFWLSIVRAQGRSRRPPKRAVVKVERDDDSSEDGE